MLHSEFENLTKLQVTAEEFNAINAMYETANQTIDKQAFCKDWMKHKDSTLLNDYYTQVCCFEKQVKELKEELETASNMMADAMANNTKKTNALKKEMAEFLIDQAEEYSDKYMARKAIELIGMKDFIAYKLQKNYTLYSKDKDYILEQMGVLQNIKENLGAGQAVQEAEFEEVV